MGKYPEKKINNQWYKKVSDSVMARNPLLDKVWAYEYGVIWNGMEGVWRLTGEQKYFDYIKNSVDSFMSEDGTQIRGYKREAYNVDLVNNGKQILMLYAETGEEKYKTAADMLRDQFREQPRTSEGGFWHKQIYPWQMWLDGIYMASPFLARYGVMFHEPELLDDVANQVKTVYKHTVDPATGLCYHAWDEKHEQFWCNPETGCSPHFWGRAMGWYMAAIVDILDYLPEEHKDRPEIIRIFNQCTEALFRVQDPERLCWYQVLDQGDRPGNYIEASASCMYVYAFAKALRKGYLPDSYKDQVKETYAALIREFVEETRDGLVNVNKIVQVSGLGGAGKRDGSFAYYMSEPIVANDGKGVGAFIGASLEVEERMER